MAHIPGPRNTRPGFSVLTRPIRISSGSGPLLHEPLPGEGINNVEVTSKGHVITLVYFSCAALDPGGIPAPDPKCPHWDLGVVVVVCLNGKVGCANRFCPVGLF